MANKNLLLLCLFSSIFSYYLYYKETIDNKEFTFKSENFIDEDTTFQREGFSILTKNIDDVSLLIAGGALVTFSVGVKISKIVPESNVDNYLKDKDDFGNSDDYKYGLTSCIVVM